ncbi:MAG: helicase, partial [Pseudomonadota bacterium]
MTHQEDYISDVFGPNGRFAQHFPAYEMREGQVALARLIDDAMRDGNHTLGEGPCGTGKGMAYAVPAVWHAHHRKKRVVIATANIALQEQLVSKDLPLLQKLLPWSFSFALLKGRNNYLCLEQFNEAMCRGSLSDSMFAEESRQGHQIMDWVDRTKTGDVSELAFVPMSSLWSKVSVSSDDCKGSECPQSSACFSERAHAEAAAADIVVTNFHMLFAHLAVRQQTMRDLVLPPFDLLVLDEAHEAAHVARDFFGFGVSMATLLRLARKARALGYRTAPDQLQQSGSAFFGQVAAFAKSPMYRTRLRKPGFADPSPTCAAVGELVGCFEEIADDKKRKAEVRAAARNYMRQAKQAAIRLREATALTNPDAVYWIDLDREGRARLECKPIDVSGILSTSLFEAVDSVSLVSATLTTSGSFSFIRKELGVPEDATEKAVESPFDFKSQAFIVIPEHGLPDPRAAQFAGAVADRVGQVVELCNGRTLGLFTSYRVLNAVYERIRAQPFQIM